MSNNLELKVNEVYTPEGTSYQCLAILAKELQPSCLAMLELPSELNRDRGVVLWGSAPTWLYARLIDLCRQALWIGCYNVPSGMAVVIASRDQKISAGDCFTLIEKPFCPAILIAGPPNSGKSVLAHALDLSLQRLGLTNAIHLHRAHWDGEGDWFAEMSNRKLALSLANSNKGKPIDSASFFKGHAEVVDKIRTSMDLLLVDFGGMPRSQDVILLQRCTHYILISSSTAQIPAWHEFCGKQGGLKLLAVVRSVLDERLEVIMKEPHLEIIAGPWEHSKTQSVPDVLRDEVLKLVRA